MTDRRTPFGQPWVEPVRRARSIHIQNVVFDELKEAFEKRIKVQGRILNTCPGGYTVGLAGLVGYLPKNLHKSTSSPAAEPKIGSLLDFEVLDLRGQTSEQAKIILKSV